MERSDLIEPIYSGDEFHSELLSLNAKYGRGDPISITWDAGTDWSLATGVIRRAIVVCQLQYGQAAYLMTVHCWDTQYILKFRRHTVTVQSDYFAS